MNWTGGRLQRSRSKASANPLVKAQGRYFAKSRLRQKHATIPSPLSFSFIHTHVAEPNQLTYQSNEKQIHRPAKSRENPGASNGSYHDALCQHMISQPKPKNKKPPNKQNLSYVESLSACGRWSEIVLIISLLDRIALAEALATRPALKKTRWLGSKAIFCRILTG